MHTMLVFKASTFYDLEYLNKIANPDMNYLLFSACQNCILVR